MGVDALDIGIKLKILKKQGKPSTQRWLLGELRKDGLESMNLTWSILGLLAAAEAGWGI